MAMLLPFLSVAMGGYWIAKSFSYGLWVMNGPGGGLFPLIAGALCVVFGVALLVRQFKVRLPSGFSFKAVYPVVGMVAIIFASDVIGLIPALGLFVTVWLGAYERYGVVKSLAVGVGTGLCIYLLFDYWLKIPVPLGYFEELLYG